jgi:hypothetical protein
VWAEIYSANPGLDDNVLFTESPQDTKRVIPNKSEKIFFIDFRFKMF